MPSSAAPMPCMPDLRIEVVYALADAQTVVRVSLAPGATVQDAVERSGILRAPARAPCLTYGIFGRRVPPTQALSDGDRVEIYRSLRVDPRHARRARAKSPRTRPR